MKKSGLNISVIRYSQLGGKDTANVDLIYEASAAEFAHWVIPFILKGRQRNGKCDIETIKLRLWGKIASFYVDPEYRWGTLIKLKKDGKLDIPLKKGTEAYKRIVKYDK